MARSRNIKPGFFKNEYLGSLNPLARLLFAGLWTLADREGRLEDRPLRIKAEILPYDNCDADALLDELADSGDRFITRYVVGEAKYIQITNFTQHQNPHVREQASIIPAPDLHHAGTRQEPCKHGTSPHVEQTSIIPAPDLHHASTRQEPYKHGTSPHAEQTSIIPAPDLHHASTRQEPYKHGASPADSLVPSTDSLKPSTDSLVPSTDSPSSSSTDSPSISSTDPLGSAAAAAATAAATTAAEKENLIIIRSIPNYPFDYSKDLDTLRNLSLDFPSIDLLAEIKKWREFKKDKPLKPKANARLQIRNWMENAVKYQKEGGNGIGNVGNKGNGGENAPAQRGQHQKDYKSGHEDFFD